MKLSCSRKEGGRSNLAHIKCTTNSYSFSNHDFRMAQVYLMKTSHQRTDLNWKQQIRMGGNGITPLKSKITSLYYFKQHHENRLLFGGMEWEAEDKTSLGFADTTTAIHPQTNRSGTCTSSYSALRWPLTTMTNGHTGRYWVTWSLLLCV